MKHRVTFLKICLLSAMLVLIQTTSVFSYRVLVNLNTYAWTERHPTNVLDNAIERVDELRCDGVWTLQHNNAFTDAEWRIIYDKLGPHIVTETQVSRSGLEHIATVLGRLPTQQMGYIEDNKGVNFNRPTSSTLTPEEIDQLSAIRDDQKLIVNVRSYDDGEFANIRKANVDAALLNPKIAGISMEYGVALYGGRRGAPKLAKAVQDSDKEFYVLIKGTRDLDSLKVSIENLITWAPDLMKSDRAYIVILRYNGTEDDWFGDGNSIKSSIAYAVSHPYYTGRGMGPRDTSLRPPTIASISNRNIDPNTSIDVPLSIAHPQKSAGTLQLYALSSNPKVIPHQNITFKGTVGNRTATITPARNKKGSATITITVSDGDFTAKTSFNVTVPPVLGTIENQVIKENSKTNALVITTGSDAVLSGTSSNKTIVPNSAITFGGSGANRTVTVTPVQDRSGIVRVTIKASSGNNENSTDFWLTIVPDVVPELLFSDNFNTSNNINPYTTRDVHPQNLNKNLDTRQSDEAATRAGYFEPPFLWADPELGKNAAPNPNVPSAIYTGNYLGTRIFDGALQVGDGVGRTPPIQLEKDFSHWLSKPNGCSFELSFDLKMENTSSEWTSIYMMDAINDNRNKAKLGLVMDGTGSVRVNNQTVPSPTNFNPQTMNRYTFAVQMKDATSGTFNFLINNKEALKNVSFTFGRNSGWLLGWTGSEGSHARFDNLKIGRNPQTVNVLETPSNNFRIASSLYNLKVNHNSLVISGLSIPKSSSAELFVYNMKGRVVDRKILDQLHTADGFYRYSTAGFSNGTYYMVVKNLEHISIKRKFFVMR